MSTDKQRNSYTVEEKLSAIAWHKRNGCNYHQTARKFNIDRKRIREWVSKEKNFLANNHSQQKKRKKIGACGRKPLSDELDDRLYEFLDSERQSARAVSNKLLKEEALKIANRLNIKDFKASDQFICNWKRRFNVSKRHSTNEIQKLPEEPLEDVASDDRTDQFIYNWKRRYTCNVSMMQSTNEIQKPPEEIKVEVDVICDDHLESEPQV